MASPRLPLAVLASLNTGATEFCLYVRMPRGPVQRILVCLTWISLQPLLAGWVKGE